jgi:hypothetical protein
MLLPSRAAQARKKVSEAAGFGIGAIIVLKQGRVNAAQWERFSLI